MLNNDIQLTNDNYFSQEMSKKYMSVSQFKNFMSCEAMALASVNGEYVRPMTDSLLVGSYVDAHFEGTLDVFRRENPQIFLKNGIHLKAQYKKANEIIQRIESDLFFMAYLDGNTQEIVTFELFGTMWKAKLDVYNPTKGFITDLKVMKSLTETFYDSEQKKRIHFIEQWGYDIQAAVYSEGVKIATNSNTRLPFFIAGASKETTTDIDVFYIDEDTIEEKLAFVQDNIYRVIQLKRGDIEPKRCGVCDYCKATKKLTKAKNYADLR